MYVTARRAIVALGLLAAVPAATPAPAAAQDAWHNPYTGRNWNNPGSSMIDTFLQNDARRRMMIQRGGEAYGQRQATSRDPSFRLFNRGSQVMREIYVSSSQVDQWGPDRLGQHVLAPNESILVQLPQRMCVNDIRIVFASGQAMERRRVDTCALAELILP
ncbi:hypothetical protein [Falsiroseomonas oryzae]|uniref:hypothetical protein n=1 Tax=Falsiroseomonas oryzae TaxID=2766473 RepID=UPI0022EA3DA8|nr:hypothetical protein [Roseomonas sp. MO-31]